MPYSPGGPASEFHEEGEEQTLNHFHGGSLCRSDSESNKCSVFDQMPRGFALDSSQDVVINYKKILQKKLSRVYIPKELELYVLVST